MCHGVGIFSSVHLLTRTSTTSSDASADHRLAWVAAAFTQPRQLLPQVGITPSALHISLLHLWSQGIQKVQRCCQRGFVPVLLQHRHTTDRSCHMLVHHCVQYVGPVQKPFPSPIPQNTSDVRAIWSYMNSKILPLVGLIYSILDQQTCVLSPGFMYNLKGHLAFCLEHSKEVGSIRCSFVDRIDASTASKKGRLK